MDCVFCNIDNSKVENTIIDESDNFFFFFSIGTLVDGYLLIVSKRHINSMAELMENERIEYEFLIKNHGSPQSMMLGHSNHNHSLMKTSYSCF